MHNRLSAHAATLESGGEVDSDAAVSVLSDEGTRTPLAPVEDVDEEETDTEGKYKQAAFYTPEVPGTPAKEEGGGLKGKGRGE